MSGICLIAALGAEASPLIRRFGLEPATLTMARAYVSDSCSLVQTGIGKFAAATATAAMLERYPDTRAVINVGLCGGNEPIGSVFIAHSVTDHASGRAWYPHLPPLAKTAGLTSRNLTTLDAIGTAYRTGHLFDMEASGVVAAASRVLDTSRIHFVKVVSDNPAQPAASFEKHNTAKLIINALPGVEALLAFLTSTVTEGRNSPEPLVRAVTGQLHHSVSETHTLRRLLTRCQALGAPVSGAQQLASYPTARALSKHLNKMLDDTGVQY